MIGVRGPRGYDGAKKLVGRKHVALVDAEGHVLALAVVPANVQDRDTLPALDDGKELRLASRPIMSWNSMTKGYVLTKGTLTVDRDHRVCFGGQLWRITQVVPGQCGSITALASGRPLPLPDAGSA